MRKNIRADEEDRVTTKTRGVFEIRMPRELIPLLSNPYTEEVILDLLEAYFCLITSSLYCGSEREMMLTVLGKKLQGLAGEMEHLSEKFDELEGKASN